jgi:hypothetical protein
MADVQQLFDAAMERVKRSERSERGFIHSQLA